MGVPRRRHAATAPAVVVEQDWEQEQVAELEDVVVHVHVRLFVVVVHVARVVVPRIRRAHVPGRLVVATHPNAVANSHAVLTTLAMASELWEQAVHGVAVVPRI